MFVRRLGLNPQSRQNAASHQRRAPARRGAARRRPMELAPKLTGLSTARLERITEHLERNYIGPGKIAGCQVAVARHGHLAYFRSFGQMDRERGKAMTDDTIFRIYSMSKPIT